MEPTPEIGQRFYSPHHQNKYLGVFEITYVNNGERGEPYVGGKRVLLNGKLSVQSCLFNYKWVVDCLSKYGEKTK